MAKYRECPNCQNCEQGTDIYECSSCGKKFCDDCQGERSTSDSIENAIGVIFTFGLMGGDRTVCPHCEEIDKHSVKYTIEDD